MKWLALAGLLGAASAQAGDMIALRYVDQDPGDAPYLTRVFVTPAFMRMDSGEDDGDFVLLDRNRRQVINVMRGSKFAMVFAPGQVPPKRPGWSAHLATEPAESGAQRYSLIVDKVVCSTGVAGRRGEDAARAMAELKAVLAATQYRVWRDAPREMQHDCDLANQVWESGTALRLGLPLEEREFTGRQRRLESESIERLRPELFRVPDGLTAINAPS